MRRHISLLEKAPRPEYEKDYGHKLEQVVENFINNEIPGMHCEHASESENRTEATDSWLILDQADKRFSLQITMTDNPEMLSRKKNRGPIVIYVPKHLVKEAWSEYNAIHQENPGLEFTYEFLPKEAQQIIIQKLMENPSIKRYMPAQAERIYHKDEN
jgi:hypothetical protein